jgi:2-aminoethylphosphonate-pyruvate transaminase
MAYILKKIRSWSEEPISITTQEWPNLESDGTIYDWVISCYTETSEGIRLPVEALRHLADKSGAKLMLDATASVGLEDDHHLADAVVYSSCKGLFGLTGAAFIGMNQLERHFVPSFVLDIDTYLQKKTTGPYHAISSLSLILDQHDSFRESVLINKARFSTRFRDYLDVPEIFQPNLCTRTRRKIQAIDEKVILYNSRSTALKGSITCHLGEVHLGRSAKGDIVNYLSIKS